MTKTKNSNNDTGKVILAAIAGAAAGAIAGILMAPASGRTTRDELNRNVNILKNSLGDSVKEFTDMGREKLNELRGESNGSHSNGERVMENSTSSKKSSRSNTNS